MGYVVVYEFVKCEGKSLFPSPFEHFSYGKCLGIRCLRVKVVLSMVSFSHVLMEESKGRRKWRKGKVKVGLPYCLHRRMLIFNMLSL